MIKLNLQIEYLAICDYNTPDALSNWLQPAKHGEKYVVILSEAQIGVNTLVVHSQPVLHLVFNENLL